MKHIRPQRGFTLVEIMVVVVIIGMLATLVTQAVIDHLHTARVDKARADISTIASAVDLYIVKNGRLPTVEELITPDAKGARYLTGHRRPPRDPWDAEYLLIELGERNRYEIKSYGADGADGTDDDLSSESLADNE